MSGCSNNADYKKIENENFEIEIEHVEKTLISIDCTMNKFEEIAYKYCKNNIIYKRINSIENIGFFEKHVGDKYNYFTLWDNRNYTLYHVKNKTLEKYNINYYEFYFLKDNEIPAYEKIDSNLHLTENIAEYFNTSWCSIAIDNDSTVYKLVGFQQNDFDVIVAKKMNTLDIVNRKHDSILLLRLFNMHKRKLINEYDND